MCFDAYKGLPVQEIKPARRRHCTDVLFLLIFVAFWGGTVFVLRKAKQDGANPDRILHGSNLNGSICGVDEAVKDRPFAAWPYPPMGRAQICVASCNDTLTDPHMVYFLESKQVVTYCIPVIHEDVEIKFSGDFDTSVGTRSFGDVWTARYLILYSAALALGLSLVYTWFCKHCAGCLVWMCIIVTIGGGAFTSYVLLTEARASDISKNRADAMKYLGWGAVIVTSIFTLVVFFMRQQIRLAVQVVKESAKVLEDITMLVLFPLIPVTLAVIYFAAWGYIAIYIFSVSNVTTKPTPDILLHHHKDGTLTHNPPYMVVHEFDKRYQNFLIAHFFGLLWNVQFLIYLGYIVIAGAVADWYFSETKNGRKKRGSEPGSLSNWPITNSFARTLRFHLGSIALGSLIIAVIQFARAVLAYIQKKASSDQPNVLQKTMFAAVQCCLKCLECCIDKVNKNGFIWISIWGDNFCNATCSSFALIWRNLARVAAINLVGAFLTGLGKFMVALISTGLVAAYVLTNSEYSEKLTSPVLPCVFVFVVSWTVASVFMLIFETVVDATFLCFLVDAEHNSGGHMMASRSLQALIGEHAGASEKEAQRRYQLKEHYASGGSQEEYRQM